MGHYLYINFDPQSNVYDRDDLCRKLEAQGAHYAGYDPTDNRIFYSYEEFFIWVMGDKKQTEAGNLIWIRITLLGGDVYKVLKLADRIGGRLYDPSLKEFIDRSNIFKTIEQLNLLRRFATSVFGPVEDLLKNSGLVRQLSPKERKAAGYFPIFGQPVRCNDTLKKIIAKHGLDRIKVNDIGLTLRTQHCLKIANIQYLHEALMIDPDQRLKTQILTPRGLRDLRKSARVILGIQ